ncbi:MAG: N-acetylmuramoyl-L-alanine amidase, partial [Lysobacter sp.]|nr:N-acetylmuramoyl-L-alanine amidase [Lysobacter sp.]
MGIRRRGSKSVGLESPPTKDFDATQFSVGGLSSPTLFGQFATKPTTPLDRLALKSRIRQICLRLRDRAIIAASPPHECRPVTSALHRSLRAAALSSLLFAAGCASVPPHNPLAQWHASPNYNQRRAQLIMLHHTQQDSVEQSLQTLRTRNSQGQVSAHYLIGDDGRIYQLVADDQRAWHAGAGRWGDISDLNSASI